MSGVTPAWVKDAVFYQIFPDRFARSERLAKPAHLERWDSPPTPYGFKGGDLYGVLEHLEFLWKVATHWIAFGVDGWRLDVPTEIDNDGFWQEFRRRVRALNPEAYLVGEVWHEAQRWLRGDQFDAVMNYPLTMACLGFFGGEQLDLAETRRQSNYRQVRPLSAAEFAEQIERCLRLYAPEVVQVMLNLLDSHDTPRFLTSEGGDQTAVRLAVLFLCTFPGLRVCTMGTKLASGVEMTPTAAEPFRGVRLAGIMNCWLFSKNVLRCATPILVCGPARRSACTLTLEYMPFAARWAAKHSW